MARNLFWSDSHLDGGPGFLGSLETCDRLSARSGNLKSLVFCVIFLWNRRRALGDRQIGWPATDRAVAFEVVTAPDDPSPYL